MGREIEVRQGIHTVVAFISTYKVISLQMVHYVKAMKARRFLIPIMFTLFSKGRSSSHGFLSCLLKNGNILFPSTLEK
jgi:hypothetical protein